MARATFTMFAALCAEGLWLSLLYDPLRDINYGAAALFTLLMLCAMIATVGRWAMLDD